MKPVRIIFILLLFGFNGYSQTRAFAADKKADAIWLKQLMDADTKQRSLKTPDSSAAVQWKTGKVIYSPDSCLRIGQIIGRMRDADSTVTYATTVQYLRQNKIVELKLPRDTANDEPLTDFRDAPIVNIYKMPGTRVGYLIISADVEWPAGQQTDHRYDVLDKYPPDLTNIERITNIVSLVNIVNDTLREVPFVAGDGILQRPVPDLLAGNSLDIETYTKPDGQSPVEFLKYNPHTAKIDFLTTYTGDSNEGPGGNSYTIVYSGTFEYRDSVFTLVTDTNYYYPALATFDTVLTTKKFKVGRYAVKATVTQRFEEIGQGVIPVTHTDYLVKAQKISAVDQVNEVDGKPLDLRSNVKLQKNGALIILLTDGTTPNHGGQCGGCIYYDSQFWLINGNSKKSLFTFSSSSANGIITYSYNNGKDINGKLYLENKTDDEGYDWEWSDANGYWQNNSTYVIPVSSEKQIRNFYIHFVTVKNKTIVKLTAGKLRQITAKAN